MTKKGNLVTFGQIKLTHPQQPLVKNKETSKKKVKREDTTYNSLHWELQRTIKFIDFLFPTKGRNKVAFYLDLSLADQ
jgi:hypothetical protein